MTVEDIYRANTGATSLTEEERTLYAQRAVATFRRLQPTMSAFARALTKNPQVKVDLDTGSPRTDGKTIWYRPPISLGFDVKHDKSKCEKRDADKVPLCPACQQREWVLVTIYHEISHIAFDSFAKVSEAEKKAAIQAAVKEAGGKHAELIAERINRAPAWMTDSYIGLSKLVSPFLPMVVNALEDARVNRSMYSVRPGTKVMFEGRNNKLFTEGVDQDGRGHMMLWSQYPLNAQAICGLLVKAEGHNVERFFLPQVAADLADPDLTMMVNKLDTIRSAQGVYHLSFEVLTRLRELGYCLMPEDPEPEQEEDSGSDDDGSSEADSQDDSDDAGEPGSGGSRSESGGGSGDGDSSDSPTDEDSTSSDTKEEDDGESQNSSGSDQQDGGGEDDDADVSDSGASEADGDSGDEASDGADSSGPEGTEDGDQDSGQADAPVDADSEPDDSGAGDSSGSDSDPTTSEAEGDAEGSGSPLSDGVEPDSSSSPSDGTSEPTEPGTGDSSPVERASEPHEPEPTDLPDEEIDTGADKGKGGTEVRKTNNPEQMGEPDDVQRALKIFGEHEEKPQSVEEMEDEQAVDVAIVQGLYFEKPSENVLGVNIHRFGDQSRGHAWTHREIQRLGLTARQAGIAGGMDVPESVLGPALLRMRVAFADNMRAKQQNNLKAGRVHSRVLGKRAWSDDERVFRKKRIPGKRDYFVLIGIDVSGSTTGMNLALAKRAAHAQAELCQRTGVSFAIYAHSGRRPLNSFTAGINLEIYEIKAEHEPWSEAVQHRLAQLGPDAENLDGHTLEFYRKRCDESPATDKIILYYTDGKMPAANHDEELEILRREILTCKRKGYTLLGVGIRTDSPVRHGLDTFQINEDSDMVGVVKHLEKRLSVVRSA